MYISKSVNSCGQMVITNQSARNRENRTGSFCEVERGARQKRKLTAFAPCFLPFQTAEATQTQGQLKMKTIYVDN